MNAWTSCACSGVASLPVPIAQTRLAGDYHPLRLVGGDDVQDRVAAWRSDRTTLGRTFASQLLANGVSLAHLERMLAHADPELTARLYGKWLPVDNPGAVDSVDDGPATVQEAVAGESGSTEAANTKGSRSGSPYLADDSGRGERIRTSDLLVPNQAL
jgi:hypothetical protein